MKKFINQSCFILHVFVLAVAEIFAIGYITNYIVERINCPGFVGLIICIAVAVVWLATYLVFAKQLDKTR